MKFKRTKKSGSGAFGRPKNKYIEGKKPIDGLKKRKNFKKSLKSKSNASDKIVKEDKDIKVPAFKINRGKRDTGNKKLKLNGREEKELFDSNKKRKSEDDGGPNKKKLRAKKGDEIPTRLDRKELKVARRKRKHNYELTMSLMKKYDGLRRKDISSDKKKIMVDEVLGIIAGHGHEVVFKHDTVRVIEICIKYGSAEQRAKLFDQFKDNIAELALKKYSKFFIKKMMKYGTKEQRSHVISSFNRKVKKCIRHKEAGDIIENIYHDFANSNQRKYLMQEFYGAEYSMTKIDDARSLEEIISCDPHKKPYILRNLKETLVSLIQKSLVSHTIVHKALLDFFTNADEKMRTEMIEAVREQLVMILHTSEGAKVTMSCLWHGTPKDRKVIVKSLKGYVTKICKEEYGHLVLLALFDCVDDTVLVQKVIIAEMVTCLNDISENHHGRKVLLYLLAPRSPSYFAPKIIEQLAQGDGNKSSKKENSVRRGELLSAISPSLIKFSAENAKTLLFDKALSQLFVAIVHNVEGDVEVVMQSVVKLATKVLDIASDDEENHVFKSASGHFAIKQLIQLDKKRSEKGSEFLFSPLLMSRMDPESLFNTCHINRGAFVVVSLLECSVSEVREEVKESLKPYHKKLKAIDNKGVPIVIKLLNK
ncbi:pumilio homolog 3-like [Dendronephthya gigantea]|uniref:pumilio homolog 3-like n=1 Tax=Dendronephthya gigantea TaxID=151771 RepID=UPI00106C5779|nr:pumilio homolog 3-like [Dendronephthya gigantea]